MNGYFLLALHAHLPFVRHPEYERFLEEDWLFEGISETYLPLIRVFERLADDRIPFRITLSLSPTLLSMLSDSLLQERYIKHLERSIELAEKETQRTKDQPDFHLLSEMYLNRFVENHRDFTQRFNRDLVSVFKRLQDSGLLELITCCATHAFLPLFESFPKAVEVQIRIAVQRHEKTFGRKPTGIWLPECGYYPGLEEYLERHGIRFFFLDAHGITFAERRPRYGVYAPLECKNGVLAFGRDPASSRAVWSAEEGYPGDISYRDFYRDIGYELPLGYIGPYIQEGGVRVNTGIKYYAITGPGDAKKPYRREEALKKVEEHSENFIYERGKQIEQLSRLMDRPPLITTPFDAELFGHWWFEGPLWLESLMRKMARISQELTPVSPLDYMEENPENQVSTPSYSSWGNKGYTEVWLNGSNHWIYRHVNKSTERMTRLAQMFSSTDGIRKRALNQAARELLLMQSSDWAFIMKTGTTVPYAVRRMREHIHNFNRIYDSLLTNHLDLNWLTKIEEKNNIFPEIDYTIYA
jgi:1,4-alpha-glucan branching enzyme